MTLTNLTLTSAEKAAEFRRRNRVYDEKAVSPGAVADFAPEGWSVAKERQTTVLLRRQRKPDEILENRFWCCLYRLGYPELNVGRNFQVPLSDKSGGITKQIDVFARDDETVVVAECKTSEEYKKKPLQKDLGEFHANKRMVAESIRKHYGRGFKPKIIWAFVLGNMSLTQADQDRAREYRIAIIAERELTYFEEISKALESAARQQFKAEYLGGQQIPALEDKKVPATRIRIGGKVAYAFTAKASDVLKRAFVNHRDLLDPTMAPTYQRLVNPNRLGKIARFLDGGGFFPNSILLNFQKKPRFDVSLTSDDKDISFGHLHLPDTYKSMRVVDGQHRLYGCAVLADPVKEPVLVFVSFEGISSGDEASLFATINKEQQKVPKKLLDELEGDLKWDSADLAERIGAIASRAVNLMNAEFGTPFEDKVVSPGLQASDDRPLTLPEVKKAIVSANLIGRVSSRGMITPGPFFVARNGELHNGDTLHRLMDALNWYFGLIRDANPQRWSDGRGGRVCNNFGVPGHIRLLGEIVRHIERRDSIASSEMDLKPLCVEIREVSEPVLRFLTDAPDEEIEKRFNVRFGSGGPSQYYFALSRIVNDTFPAFLPGGFREWKSEITKEEQEKADRDAKWIQDKVHGLVVDRLRGAYGDDFFDRAIFSKEIKLKAHDKRMSEEAGASVGGPENFLDFLDLKKIVEYKENWQYFDDIFNIRLPEQKKGIAKYIQWFDEINRIRRVSAHPYKRAYSKSDVEILRLVIQHVNASL